MSVNIALIPLALAMYVVMGEEKFNNWVRSLENIKYTSFKNIMEIRDYIIDAGYDIKEEFGILKTHFDLETNDYFTWDIRDGKLCAVFSIYDDTSQIDNFIKKIEKISGRKIFFNDLNTDIKTTIKEELTEIVFQTKFADEKLLIRTLEDIGLCCIKDNDSITCKGDGYELVFYKNKNSNYEFKISGNIEKKEAFKKYKNIDIHYGKIVQKETIDNVKRKLKENNSMILEKEEMLEDNSIVLTINVM